MEVLKLGRRIMSGYLVFEEERQTICVLIVLAMIEVIYFERNICES